MIRRNRNGFVYSLEADTFDRRVSRNTIVKFGKKQMVFPHNIEVIDQGWYNWLVKDMLIQDAFPFLTPDEREFLINGLTPEDRELMFSDIYRQVRDH